MEEIVDKLTDMKLIEKFGLVSLSQKNKPQLCYAGHYFRLSTKVINTEKNVKWRCTHSKCNVKCETKGCVIGEYYDLLNYSGIHVDTSKTNKLSKLEYRRKMKRLACLSDECPRKIVAKVKASNPMNNEELAEPEYVKLDERLNELVSTYEKIDFEEYYQNMSLLLNY